MISARIIADSINSGNRITTFVVSFPRIILAEVNTHRAFSRNSASSRAIPFKKMLQMVKENPFIPIAWQKDHKGMQGTEYVNDKDLIQLCVDEWLQARDEMIRTATILNQEEFITKQLCNRLLEPFMYHTAIITATDFENFFELRCPKYLWDLDKDNTKMFHSKKDWLKEYEREFSTTDKLENKPLEFWLDLNKGQGEIHIMALAEAMWDIYNENKPIELKVGEWHIPFGDTFNEEEIYRIISDNYNIMWFMDSFHEREQCKVKIASARCARVSYLNFEGKDDYEADIKLHDILLASKHMSPFEHCAKAMGESDRYFANFKGFIQYRKLVER